MNSENQIKTRLPQGAASIFGRAPRLARSPSLEGPRVNVQRKSRAHSCDWGSWGIRVVAAFLVILLCTSGSFAYSVLTHEEIIDLVGTDEIRPFLLMRFPGLTQKRITEAHAYAYLI